MVEGKKVSALFPKSWKKSWRSGILIPTKTRFCQECNDKKLWNKFFNQVNENKDFEANLILLKRKIPNEFGYMLP